MATRKRTGLTETVRQALGDDAPAAEANAAEGAAPAARRAKRAPAARAAAAARTAKTAVTRKAGKVARAVSEAVQGEPGADEATKINRPAAVSEFLGGIAGAVGFAALLGAAPLVLIGGYAAGALAGFSVVDQFAGRER